MRNRLSFTIFLLLSLSWANAQKGSAAFVDAPNLKHADISFLVKEISSGQVIMQHREEKVVIPASTMKVVTTATALELLSPDFRFETKLQYAGSIKDSVLYGNIYILGGGDPTLGSQYMGEKDFLDKWASAVKQLGIRRIDGAIVGDASAFSSEGVAPKWSWEDMGNYYSSGAYALSIYDNTYQIQLQSGAAGTTPQIVSISPSGLDIKFNLQLLSANIGKDSAYIYGAPFSHERFIYGAIPANRKNFVVKGDIPHPPLFAAQELEAKLKTAGISISQPAKAIFLPEGDRNTFHTLYSPPLKDILKEINHRSNNHYAEHLFRSFSMRKNAPATIKNSVETTKLLWKKKHVDVSGLNMYDGCGLSLANAISAKFLVDLLIYEKSKSAHSDVFFASLPSAGQTGTISRLLKGTALEGRVQAKSGSVGGVQCYAGYISWQGKQYAFAVLLNHFEGTRSKAVGEIEKLLLSITNQ